MWRKSVVKGPMVGWRRENASERLSSMEYREQGDSGLKSDWILFPEQANPRAFRSH